MTRAWPWLLAGALFVLVTIAGIVYWNQRYRSPLLSLSAGDRRVLYEKNLNHFALMCESETPVENKGELCRAQAEVLRQFPECDDACQRRVAVFLPGKATK